MWSEGDLERDHQWLHDIVRSRFTWARRAREMHLSAILSGFNTADTACLGDILAWTRLHAVRHG